MRRRLQEHPVSIAAFAALLILTTASCRKREAPSDAPPVQLPDVPPAAAATVRVIDTQLGSALGADKRVAEAKETFAPKDTIFVVVATEGSSPGATLAAKWTYQDGQTVDEGSRSIAPTGPAVTEFSIQKADGWPKGDYKVEILLDGQSAATRSFKVQ